MSQTRRPTVAVLEPWLERETPVLDHGFIRVIDYMGDDSAVVQAARVSYGQGTRKVSEDVGLIRYLMSHRHTTPMEMCEIKLHVKLPIFVARQWIRHRTASINEVSARYSVLDKEFYIPDAEHMASQSSSNRQGRGDLLHKEEAAWLQSQLRTDAARCYEHYEWMLNEPDSVTSGGSPYDPNRDGLSRELARINLTLNTYTQWYWKTDLHNLFNFLSLRADPHAQYEIRAYADVMLEIVKAWVPVAYEAFLDYRLNAVTFSAQQMEFLRIMLRGAPIPNALFGMSKRERDELLAAVGKLDAREGNGE